MVRPSGFATIVLASIVLTACGGEERRVSDSAPASPEAPRPSAPERPATLSLDDFGLEEADFLIIMNEDAVSELIRPERSRVVAVDGAPLPALAISGVATDATSAGRTGGVAIKVPDAVEAAAPGKAVKVSAVARASAAPASLGLAYSTNEMGNSGWTIRTLSDEFALYEMIWAVPKGETKAGDFIGLKPAPAAEIAAVAVSVVERPEPGRAR
ncbi:MAG: hypothetical protein AAFV51_14400 [Pseudomonadota bacterium]